MSERRPPQSPGERHSHQGQDFAVFKSRLRQGWALHQRGELDQAERIYREVLTVLPDDFDALQLLGMLEGGRGNPAAAMEWMSRAVRVNPRDASVHSNMGLALLELKRPAEALASFERALGLLPDFADALNGRGIALLELKRPEEALAGFERALGLAPDLPIALYGRGNALLELKRPGEALASYDRALALRPEHVDALVNRGNAQLDLKRPGEALASFDHALGLEPDHVNALINRGNALVKLKRLEAALAAYDRALVARPGFAEAISRRADALAQHGRHEEAIADFRKLLAINPAHDYAAGLLLHMQLHCCEWTDHGRTAAQIVEAVRAGRRVDLPFSFQAVSDSAADQLSCSRIFAADRFPAASQPLWRGERYRHDRIRLAYLSADFRVHPSSSLLAGLFEHHDRSRFETMAISFGDDDGSGIRARLKAAFERFFDVRDRSDLAVARLMRELEVDIAVDLTGHTQYARTGILAFRPAPVQVNFFCPGTSGADYLDYIVCDRIVIPEDHHVHYSEKVVYLPDTFQANDSRRSIAERTPTRAGAGLPDDGFVFCSFNQPYKFTPAMFDVWMRLLHRVEGSVLWLQQINAASAGNLRGEAIRRGIDANRLVFAPRVPRMEDHLARYRLADLFLDTLPYNAQTTASDALWAGLPLITCLGTTFSGRVAASLLNAVGLPELIARSLPEYEALALDLATQPARLAHLRSKLARNRATCPLFDTARFCRHIESAFVAMWERHQRGGPPASFAVPGLSWQL
jgi:predicted O-linked N-acetylglucosamine transferase (SPINDLY family)